MATHGTDFNFKRVTRSITINEDLEEKCFIIARRKGKEYIRNYKRPMKNGKSFVDLLIRKYFKTPSLLEAK